MRANGVTLRQGGKEVVLSGEVPVEAFDRVSQFFYDTGLEGSVLWTPSDGYVPVELPTGDSESSLSIRVVGSKSSPRASGATSPSGRGFSAEVKNSEKGRRGKS